MSTVELWILRVHVAAGVVAVLAGIGAMVTTKGGLRHRQAGKVFVASMGVVVGTVFPLLAFGPTPFRVFLTLVGVFSGYLAFSGYRVLSRKRPADVVETVDWVAAGGVVVACLALGGWGTDRLLGGDFLGVVMVTFGAIGVAFGTLDVRSFRAADRGAGWMVTHLQRMIGAFVATVSAVSVTTLSDALGFVAWLWPTAVLVPLIVYWSRKYDDA